MEGNRCRTPCMMALELAAAGEQSRSPTGSFGPGKTAPACRASGNEHQGAQQARPSKATATRYCMMLLPELNCKQEAELKVWGLMTAEMPREGKRDDSVFTWRCELRSIFWAFDYCDAWWD